MKCGTFAGTVACARSRFTRNFEILPFEIRQFAVRRGNFIAFMAVVFVQQNLCVKARARPAGRQSSAGSRANREKDSRAGNRRQRPPSRSSTVRFDRNVSTEKGARGSGMVVRLNGPTVIQPWRDRVG